MTFDEVLAELRPLDLGRTEDRGAGRSLYEALERMYKLADKVGKTGFRASQATEMLATRLDGMVVLLEEQVGAREQDLRIERERIGQLREEQDRVVRALVEVLDLATAASAAVKRESGHKLGKRFDLLLRQMLDACARCGLDQTAEASQAYDPDFHEAVEEIDTPAGRAREIVEVIRQGYRYRGRLVRVAKVTVTR